ncbi:type IVB secretion system apparatus protein IcmL/DotI [Sulfitobacter sp. 1A13353]|jgi:intracellular multiplication protein IcmL|uniref:type IVB secretion system apparatus protein IcmL/DotI n=1 Tax=Sulfitobacter sp. 1A13353 TaxID=3368568 RepID=UPI00374740BA
MAIKDRSGAVESPLARYETYQKAFRVSAIGNVIMAVATTASIAMAWGAYSSQPEPRYFATREDGGIIPLVAVSSPFLNNGQVTNFAVEAVTRALTMDFKNWREDLAQASEYFQRPEGWNNFLTAIDKSGTLDFVRNKRLISNAVANGATIVDDGVDALGRYSWTVQIPLKVTFESANERSVEDMMAEVIVSRLPTWESSKAVGITRITMR